jgi:hypothetical protein
MILMVVAVAQKRWIHLSAMSVASENVSKVKIGTIPIKDNDCYIHLFI